MPVDVCDPNFVTAYSKVTGRKKKIPRAWLDIPALAAQWSKTPLTRAAEAAEGPSMKWTRDELLTEADRVGADHTDKATKQQLITAIQAASPAAPAAS